MHPFLLTRTAALSAGAHLIVYATPHGLHSVVHLIETLTDLTLCVGIALLLQGQWPRVFIHFRGWRVLLLLLLYIQHTNT